MNNILKLLAIVVLTATSCSIVSTPNTAPASETVLPPIIPPAIITESFSSAFSPETLLTMEVLLSASPTETFTPLPPTETSTSTPAPYVDSLKATTTEKLICRYGPGPEYLYLFAFNKGANIQIAGRIDGNKWVLVENKTRCWVNPKYLEIKGDPKTLKPMYPDGYKLIVSPYYSPTTVLSAVRDPNNRDMVTVKWIDIPLTRGDEEDENMFIYIIEVWRCEGGQIIFEPLASNYPEVTFVDETGCSTPSHGRVYFQEKHGYAGPAEIPWPIQ